MSLFGGSAIKAAGASFQQAGAQVKQGEDVISQARAKMAYIQDKIQFKPEYWTALDKTSTSIQNISKRLDPTKDESTLNKLQSFSKIEDMAAMLGVLALLGSIILVAFLSKRSKQTNRAH